MPGMVKRTHSSLDDWGTTVACGPGPQLADRIIGPVRIRARRAPCEHRPLIEGPSDLSVHRSPLRLRGRSRGQAVRRARSGAARRGASGQSIVELALILPVMMAMLLVVTDFGRLFATYVGVKNAAREGAAYGMMHPTCWSAGTGTNQCLDPTNVTYVARQELGGDTGLVVSVVCTTACASATTLTGNSITVTATRTFTFLFPMVPTVTLGSSSTAVIP